VPFLLFLSIFSFVVAAGAAPFLRLAEVAPHCFLSHLLSQVRTAVSRHGLAWFKRGYLTIALLAVYLAATGSL
jgi:hypothetical protein